MNPIKIIIILLFLAVLFNLGLALRQLFRRDDDHSKMAKALTWRIGISFVLFIIIVILVGSGQLGINPSPIQAQ